MGGKKIKIKFSVYKSLIYRKYVKAIENFKKAALSKERSTTWFFNFSLGEVLFGRTE